MSSPDTEFISILGAAGNPEAPVRVSSSSLPQTLPVLGLSDIVIFPGMVAPLLVETVQSTKLIDDVVGGDRLLGVVLQRNAEAENPLPHEMHEVGCAARVLKMLKFPDSTVRVLVEGLWRILIREYTSTSPYLCAKFELLKDVTEDSVELTAMMRNAQTQFQEIIKLSPALSEQIKIAAINTEDPGHFADLIAVNLNLDLAERQKLLETRSVKERLTRLLPMLNREHEVLTLSSKIQTEVATSISKTQRDFFLREQLRAIQRELGESDPNASEIRLLREKIDQTELPPEAKQVATQELDRLQQMPPAAAEYGVTRHYLDWILALPWMKETEDKIDLKDAERILNEQHFGLMKVKDRLIEFLAVIKRRKQIKGPILCLVGPPGVGKTSLGRSVAEALGRKFARIALGGMRDEAEIRGHRRTYVGSLPGRIIQTLRRVESRNPVILLDELDKVGADFRGDPASALLEVLDPAQNNTFTDHYLDLPFDLSRVLFITTANWLDPVHPALRDRLEVIELPSYTESEKLQIAKRYLVPRQLEEHGLTTQEVKFPDLTLRRVIHGYTREAGVRQLEREIAALSRKATRRLVGNGHVPKPLVLKPELLRDYLGAARFVNETAERIKEYGIATGLAWTPVGGEILFIEATRMPGKGNLLLTGSLGEVMKESAQTAVSYLRSQSKALEIDLADYSKFDIHIHVPAGATPKDGPSAGVALVAALASLLTRCCVRSDVAMTGEISLRGRVMRVGGIKEKVLAANRFGIKEVILPEQNQPDWTEVPEEVRERLKVHFIRHISNLLPLALRQKKNVNAGVNCRVSLFVLLFAGVSAFGQPRSGLNLPKPIDPVQSEKDGRALVADLLAQKPDENVTNIGVLTIRDRERNQREIPVRVEVSATPTGWKSVYRTLPPGSQPGVELTVIHNETQPNQYLLCTNVGSGPKVPPKKLSPEEIMAPFAGSDFWIADLGLEYLHWPKQRVLRKELRHSRSCAVLESSNPQNPIGPYATIISWVDLENGGVVHADAFDSNHKRLKQFDPTGLKKIKGQRQLEEIEMQNAATGSRTFIKFNLKAQP